MANDKIDNKITYKKKQQSSRPWFPANIYLDEDFLKTSWRRLPFLSSEDVFKTSS